VSDTPPREHNTHIRIEMKFRTTGFSREGVLIATPDPNSDAQPVGARLAREEADPGTQAHRVDAFAGKPRSHGCSLISGNKKPAEAGSFLQNQSNILSTAIRAMVESSVIRW
jgi:hypothetical protein